VAKPPRAVCIDEDLGNFQFGIDLWQPRPNVSGTPTGVSTLRAPPAPHFPEIGPNRDVMR
jgi:hypothetical protein